ncbi:MAG: sensor histidine kinase [Chloroflexi bacterium]|nr:sensor histidine kinase [Chloroflexota bacterium]
MNRLLDAFERDREFIALELHDNVLQTLASAVHHLQAAESKVEGSPVALANLGKGLRLVRQSIDAAREVVGELRPVIVDRLGVIEALRWDLEELQQETGWQVEFEVEAGRISSKIEMPLYRILREAIANAKRHSASRSLAVRIWREHDPPALLARVEDRGRGFDPSRVGPGSLGLLSMQIRAEALGGQCRIESAVGQGTAITVSLPLRH